MPVMPATHPAPRFSAAVPGLARLILLAAAATPLQADDPPTLDDLLHRVCDVQRLVSPPAATERALIAAGQGPVEQRIAGPGVLTRIAVASLDGRLKVNCDDQTVFDGPLHEFFSHGRPPFAAPLCLDVGEPPGGCSYFPIPFARECVISLSGAPGAYVIEAATLTGAPTPLTLPLDAATAAVLAETEKALQEGLSDRRLLGTARRLPIAVEGQFTANRKERQIRETIEGAGTIRALYVALTDRNNPRALYVLHGCILRIYFDGAAQPAVEAPLCDFFGSGFDLTAVGGLPVGTDKLLELPIPDRRAGQETFLYCHFPMPFTNGAAVEIENVGGAKFSLLLYLEVDRTPPPADALRFHARYRRTESWSGPLSLAKLAGPGRLVGCLLNVDCPTTAPWFSGSVAWRRDGETAAAPLAADIASFFGVAGHAAPLGHAFFGASRGGPYGKTSLYRWLIPDSLPFQKSALLTLKPPADPLPPLTYVGALLYWYAPAGAPHDFKPLDSKTWAPPGLRIPGAVEIEGRVQGSNWGTESKQRHAGAVEFSGEAAARIATADPVQIVLPAARAGRVHLQLRFHPRRRFETVEVSGPDGKPIGTVTYDIRGTGIYDVGATTLAAGDNTLTVKCSKPAVLDCWIVTPRP